MNFIILYNRETGYTDKVLFEPDDQKAYKLFKDSIDKYQGKNGIDVNFVSAKDEADLKKTWGRFFTRNNPPFHP